MNLRHLRSAILVLHSVAVACTGLACRGSAPAPVLGASLSSRPLGLTTSAECSVCKCDGPCNGLSTEALPKSSELLKFLGGLTDLTSDSLKTTITSDVLKELEGPDGCESGPGSCASKLMAYIVSCALDAGESVEVSNPPAINALRWTGEMGLCNGGSGAPKWPDPGCLQAVSACVLARVNALGLRVPISIHGQLGTFAPQLRTRIPVQREFRENNGTDNIKSFEPCSGTPLPMPRPGDPSRDCGWAPRSVGRCGPGEVHLNLNSGSGKMVRVCKGIHGCNHNGSPPVYAGLLKEADSATTDITFACPIAHEGRQYGYFGVMVASDDPAAPPPAPRIDVNPTSAGTIYPAPEDKVFTYREGAFYGNIFTPAVLTQSVAPLAPPLLSLFGDQFACYDLQLSSTNAELAGRLCALQRPKNCFGNNPYPCLNAGSESNSCLDVTASPEGSYRVCHGFKGNPPVKDMQVWQHGLTVFLNDPCDFAFKENEQFYCANNCASP